VEAKTTEINTKVAPEVCQKVSFSPENKKARATVKASSRVDKREALTAPTFFIPE
jgi:hypothetical protein